jgi:hypothetical protein
MPSFPIKHFIYALFLICLNLNATEFNIDIEKINYRIDSLTEKLEQGVFTYDIELRKEVVVSLERQKFLLSQLGRYEERLLNVEKLSGKENNPLIEQLREELEVKLIQIQALQKSTIDTIIITQQNSLDSAIYSSDKALSSSQHFTYWLIYSFAALTTLFGSMAAWYGVKANKNYHNTLEVAKASKDEVDKTLDEVDKTLGDAKDIKNDNAGLKKELTKTISEIRSLHQEMKSINGVMDFRENYRILILKVTDKENPDKGLLLSTPLIHEAGVLLDDLEKLRINYERDNKNTSNHVIKKQALDEILANISYISYARGVLYFLTNEVEKSYSSFKTAKKHNVRNFTDRPHNLACVAAALYIKSGKKNKEFLNEVILNYRELMKNQDVIKKLRKEKDIEFILDEIERDTELNL